MNNRLIIIVPCYNEEEVLPWSAARLLDTLNDLIAKGKIADNSRILFVNDGSRDKTWDIIRELKAQHAYVWGLHLAGNVGHQNALLAGIEIAKDSCDIAISIDADLQDDIAAIEEMVERYTNDGVDIVYGVRADRHTDSCFKRVTAQGFYKLMKWLGADTVYNHADYRLMSRRALQQLCQYKERNLFIRGIVPKLGYQSACVYYTRQKRTAGKSKYPFKKMLAFAWDGITSLSIRPITLIMALGIAAVFLSLIAFVYILCSLITGSTVLGWASIMASIWFLGGVQLVSIGIIGQYIGKTYIESKERPRYTIESFLGD